MTCSLCETRVSDLMVSVGRHSALERTIQPTQMHDLVGRYNKIQVNEIFLMKVLASQRGSTISNMWEVKPLMRFCLGKQINHCISIF